MKSIRKGILLLMILCSTMASAQNINVVSFKLLENDLTANTTGTIERDQNGEIAALIKIVTTAQGFVFDGGMVGIVKTKQEVGEIWVYVPHGIKRITMKHPQLGVLRDYYFPISIEKARTYEMVLSTGRVETVVTHSINKQFVVFNVKPTNSVVELDDEMLSIDSEGFATKSVPYGTYTYRVSCADYHTEAGQIIVSANEKTEVNVSLKPNFGWLKIHGEEEIHGAYIYIGNERIGQLPLTTDAIKSGTHQVRVIKPMYKTYERQVSVVDNETLELNVELEANFADVTLKTDKDSEIWVDGEMKGTGQWKGPMVLGEYTVEVKKESCRTVSEIIQISEVGEKEIELKSPIQVLASLEISSSPMRATVYIDDVEVGETPLIKNDLPVGTCRLKFKKQGYATMEKTVELLENVENKVFAEMEEDEDIITKKRVAQVKEEGKEKIKNEQKTKEESEPSLSEKESWWRFLLGADVGYSDYGYSYGGEVGIVFDRFSLTAGAMNYLIGEYTSYLGKVGYDNKNATVNKIELLRFTTKLGYSLPVGKYILVTPQVGMVFGPSFNKGKEYIMGGVMAWNEIPDNDYKGMVLAPNADYSVMNEKIMKFATMRYGCVLGARLEVVTANSRFGLHVSPEYVIGEGMMVNAGLIVRL